MKCNLPVFAALAVGLLGSAFVPSAKASGSMEPKPGTETVVLAGGCFWGMQGVFEHVKGVKNTVVGYAGGTKDTAYYERVSQKDTGHAESIKITWDPTKLTYRDLLKIYFTAAHDPTTLNRQHNDDGPEYRSAIFYFTDEQKTTAEAYIKELNAAHAFRNPIVTQVVPLNGAFFQAEPDHQHFLDRNPTQGYIANVDIPLQNEFKEKYPQFYSKESK